MGVIMLSNLTTSIRVFLLFSLLCGVAYPAIMTGVINLTLPKQAEGSLITGADGKIYGSALVGQNFTDPKYFWGRLSATGPVPYNAAASSGSNLGSSNANLQAAVEGRLNALRAADPANTNAVPVDLVTASGSGLDPHISPAAAFYQLERVAKARNLPVDEVRQLVEAAVEKPQWGFLGEARVNVLLLNLRIDGKLARQ
jgi:potassium-transporting ATPase KdpC subunit